MTVFSEDPWHSHLLPSVGSGSVTICFYDLGLSRLGFEHSIFRLPDERSNPLRHPRSLISVIITINYANICY